MFYLYLLFSIQLVASTSQNLDLTGSYDVVQTVLMHDESDDPVGYQVTSTLSLTPKGSNVYLIKMKGLGLHIMSRKAPTPHGFIPHSSSLESAVNKDFMIEYKSGLVKAIHLAVDDSVSLRNMKRAIGSLFQLNLNAKEGTETDSSGICSVRYERSNLDVTKYKSNCRSTPNNFTSDVWGGSISSESAVKFTLSDGGSKISSIVSSESHKMESHLAEFASTMVTSSLSIHKQGDTGESGSLEYSGSSDDIIANTVIEIGGKYNKHDLTLENEADLCTVEKCPKLDEVLKESIANLADFGSAKSAAAVLGVAKAMRRANHQQISKVFNSKDNKKVLGILLDIAGTVQTFDSHQAALKKLKINTDKYNLDLCERYLWALSLYPKPSHNITHEMLQLVKEKHHDKKLFQTILQTGAAMAHKLSVLHNDPNHKILTELVEVMIEELNSCESDDEACRLQYLSALGQTQSPLALPVLMKHVIRSTTRSGVEAMKGIQKLGPSAWTPEVYKLAEQVLFSDSGADSSSKTIALDILLSRDLTEDQLGLIISLLSRRQNKELNQLILQKLSHKASKCVKFSSKVKRQLAAQQNWDLLAAGGLSTSFSRNFMERGFLSTDQEIANGILKRGLVNVNLAHNNSINTLFTLGLFSTGLGSFVSNSQENNGDEEEEATAGMQIELLGVQFRPFVFFTGTGDLMGHVWSGTASTKTPAYQAAIVVSRGEGRLPVGPAGAWAELNLDVAASLELAGLIEISLWNRNANSAVFNRLGLAVGGGIKVNNDFVRTKVDLHLAAEPSLDLTSQIDFSSTVSLCLKLYQPSSVIRYNTYKVERIPGSKHKLRKSRYSTRPVPGKTYALNRKNNEMCNAIHNE